MDDLIELLRECNIQATPQRLAVAQFILGTKSHPTADEVWRQVRRRCPTISRATVYNTLNLLAEKGLLKAQVIKEGVIVFDAHINKHHHFIDEKTGRIYDIPWDAIVVTGQKSLKEYDVTDIQVVMRGRKRKS